MATQAPKTAKRIAEADGVGEPASAAPMRMSAGDAARFLGVSARSIYDLAAPGGPIPCYRIGGRIVFDSAELEAYLQSCRVTPTPRVRVSRLTSTPMLKVNVGESELETLFRARGIKPKSKPPARKKRGGSTLR
jgi:excisionase family DNA binding protein